MCSLGASVLDQQKCIKPLSTGEVLSGGQRSFLREKTFSLSSTSRVFCCRHEPTPFFITCALVCRGSAHQHKKLLNYYSDLSGVAILNALNFFCSVPADALQQLTWDFKKRKKSEKKMLRCYYTAEQGLKHKKHLTCSIWSTLPYRRTENSLVSFSADHVVITFTNVNPGTSRMSLLFTSPMW